MKHLLCARLHSMCITNASSFYPQNYPQVMCPIISPVLQMRKVSQREVHQLVKAELFNTLLFCSLNLLNNSPASACAPYMPILQIESLFRYRADHVPSLFKTLQMAQHFHISLRTQLKFLHRTACVGPKFLSALLTSLSSPALHSTVSLLVPGYFISVPYQSP